MADQFSKAKNAILRTGLPLEHTVEGVLRDIGWRALSPDFPYSRLGAVAAREVDMVALQTVGSETFESERGETRTRYNATRNIIVECKYRRRGVYWLFAPYLGPEQPYKWYGPRVDYRGYLAVRNGGTHPAFTPPVRYFVPPSDRLPAAGEHESHPVRIPVCARGVAVLDDKEDGATADQSQLRSAVQQIRFAFVPFVWSTLRASVEQARAMAFGQMTARDGAIATAVFSSFIVTTADLFMLKPNVDIHGVEQSTMLADVAEPIDALELLTFPSDELREHNKTALAAYRSWSNEDLSDPRVRRFFEYWEPIASELENVSPSVFVVKLGALNRVLRAQSRFIEGSSLESAREAAARLGTPHWA